MNAHRSDVPNAPGKRVAIDVGGTFTDVVVLDEADTTVRFDKTSTTPADPSAGVFECFKKAGVQLSEASYFIHGTTLALNALITRSGGRVALVTTAGFRDVYELGRTDREEMYSLTYRKPDRLVPRSLVFEVPERLDFEGQPLRALDEVAAARVVEQIGVAGIDAVAVCFLHSYANPAHELAMEALLRTALPRLEITVSHRLVREYREYERTSTAVIDAYVKRVVRQYLDRLSGTLGSGGFRGRFLVTSSAGGAMTVEGAIEQPSRLVLSGPASGVLGAAALGAMIGEPRLITIDMGGTSLDASLVIDGRPTIVGEGRFQGQPLAMPALNIHTIGAGGGSIAWLDKGGHLQVGPQSAGAVPGPACYGRGGQAATVTDAALWAGFFGETAALGGEIAVQRGLADGAIASLAKALDVTPATVVDGILDLTTAKISGAVREITLEQGHDPRDFALLAYGGAGGLLACEVARDLGISRVIVPPGPGAFSAFGMLMTDVVHDFSQTKVVPLPLADRWELASLFAQLDQEARSAVERDGFGPADSLTVWTADLRYEGQEHTVAVPVGALDDGPSIERMVGAFNELHETRYGHRMTDPVEMVTARVRVIGQVPRPKLRPIGAGKAEAARVGERTVVKSGEEVEYQVLRREGLGRGNRLRGPLIVEERTGTTVVGAADELTVGDFGELLIAVGAW